MKKAVVTIVIALIVGAALAALSWDSDGIDVERILKNGRLFRSYFNCIINKGPCAPEALLLKRALPEALKTECAKCTENQKEKAKWLIQFMQEKKADQWKQFTDKYDPNGIYSYLYTKPN